MKSAILKVWAYLKAVPMWIYTVIGWLAAFLIWRIARRKDAQFEIQSQSVKAIREKSEELSDVRHVHDAEIQSANDKHAEKMAEVSSNQRELDDTNTDEEISDAVNDAWGEE